MPAKPEPGNRLSVYPWREIVINCHVCNRHAQVAKERFLKTYGDLALADLALRIAADRSCPTADTEQVPRRSNSLQ